jgi:Formin Homology 2 Domain
VQLVEGQRSHNICIELSGIHMAMADIKAALTSMRMDSVGTDAVLVLQRAVPTAAECDDIRAYLAGKHPKYRNLSDVNRLGACERCARLWRLPAWAASGGRRRFLMPAWWRVSLPFVVRVQFQLCSTIMLRRPRLRLRAVAKSVLLACRYFLHIMDVPHIAERLACVLFMRNFDAVVKQVRHHIDLMDAARAELRGSADFKLLLQHVLAVGNCMNMGTAKGAAQARGPLLMLLAAAPEQALLHDGSDRTLHAVLVADCECQIVVGGC